MICEKEKCGKPTDLKLPCEHFICTGCSRDISDKADRTYGLVCPISNCTALFSLAEEPHHGKTIAVKDEYKSEIEVVKDVIKPISGKVMGMTILKSSLYVVCSNPKHVILKYDISVSNEIKRKPVELSISQMKWPRGIAASESSDCLYVTDWDWDKIFRGKLWRYNCRKEQRTEDPVATLDIQPFGVSVSPRNGEVLVTCATPIDVFHKRGWIYVFEEKEEGLKETRIIDLPGLQIPRHAILTKSSFFLVCHGWTVFTTHGVTSYQDPPAGIPIKQGFYGKSNRNRGDQFTISRPLSMALDKDGLLLVVDYENHRIQLLTDSLHLVRDLITANKHHVRYPRHVCVDPNSGRIYVGQKDGQIIVFEGRSKGNGEKFDNG